MGPRKGVVLQEGQFICPLGHLLKGLLEKELMDRNCRSVLKGHIIPFQNCISKASASHQ